MTDKTEPLPYTLIRSDRRTLALVVDRTGALIVRAPKRLPVRDIEAFVIQKEKWILGKQEQAEQRKAASTEERLRDGMSLPMGHGALPLRMAEVAAPFFERGTLWLPMHRPLAQSLKEWLLAMAKQTLPPEVQKLEVATGLRAQQLCFSSAKTFWGSMSAKGILKLNIALVLCPSEVVEYVIVHELVHRVHLNHSPAFWAEVEKFFPTYREQRAWLKKHNDLTRLVKG